MPEAVCEICKQPFRGLTGREKTCIDCKLKISADKAARAEAREKARRKRAKEQKLARIAAKKKRVEKLQAEINEMLGSL